MFIRKQKGFTLIELLVVIAIIGLLSTLAVVSLNSAREKARDARREADIRLLNNAIQLYVQENDKAPLVPNDANKVCDSSEVCWASGGDFAVALSTYTAPLVTDPKNDAANDYVYVYVSPTALETSCPTCTSESYQFYVKTLEKDASTWGFNISENDDWIDN